MLTLIAFSAAIINEIKLITDAPVMLQAPFCVGKCVYKYM